MKSQAETIHLIFKIHLDLGFTDVARNVVARYFGEYIGECELNIESLDAPLIAPGESSRLDYDDQQPVLDRGMHFNLYNNIWGANFPLWYDNDARFRFELSLHTDKELAGCFTAA